MVPSDVWRATKFIKFSPDANVASLCCKSSFQASCRLLKLPQKQEAAKLLLLLVKGPVCETGLFFCLKSSYPQYMIWKWKKWSELSTDELYNIIQVREEVFIVEQKLSYVDCDDYDQKAWHLMGYDNNKLVAYLRAFPPGAKYPESAFGRVLTTKAGRGKGAGKELTAMGIKKIRETFGDYPVKISAQSYLEKFYSDFGFERISEDYLEEGIPHVSMLLKRED